MGLKRDIKKILLMPVGRKAKENALNNMLSGKNIDPEDLEMNTLEGLTLSFVHNMDMKSLLRLAQIVEILD